MYEGYSCNNPAERPRIPSINPLPRHYLKYHLHASSWVSRADVPPSAPTRTITFSNYLSQLTLSIVADTETRNRACRATVSPCMVYGPWQRSCYSIHCFERLRRPPNLFTCPSLGLLLHTWLLLLRHPRLHTPVSACSFPRASNAKRLIMCLRALLDMGESGP